MLVARAQLDFIRTLVAQFERRDSLMRPVNDYQSHYIAIIALLRSVGHVFDKVDCVGAERKAWGKVKWKEWQKMPIFRTFIEPQRNALLKEFRGGLELKNDAFVGEAIVADPGMPEGVSHHVAFDADQLRTTNGELIMPKIRQALVFWDNCLTAAERAFPE